MDCFCENNNCKFLYTEVIQLLLEFLFKKYTLPGSHLSRSAASHSPPPPPTTTYTEQSRGTHKRIIATSNGQ